MLQVKILVRSSLHMPGIASCSPSVFAMGMWCLSVSDPHFLQCRCHICYLSHMFAMQACCKSVRGTETFCMLAHSPRYSLASSILPSLCGISCVAVSLIPSNGSLNFGVHIFIGIFMYAQQPCLALSGSMKRPPTSPESRALLWLAFARACVHAAAPPLLEATSAAFAAAAAGLASCTPYVIALDALRCRVGQWCTLGLATQG